MDRGCAIRTCHLVIFARYPRFGRVKRRLARDIGAMAALRFYRAQFDRAIRTLGGDPRWRTWLALTPDGADGPALTPARRRGVAILPQGRGDLGQRMARILRSLPPGPAVILGSDIPGVTRAHARAAFDRLGTHEAVLGPAPDGGYWLIGLRRAAPLPDRLFAGVRWSSAYAYEDTLAGFPASWRVAREAELEDIDDGDDYQGWLGSDGLGREKL
ncbi:TIGR04282 family arsenosugar biosynthesis glycosyltransferase [Marivibrio halodurans]|uniref:TIGR04282 family arsenosugar biosynthesis glycosyltransferase n=1 Tax=Marivibrio halodurans TaxID=2039722 RepID=A0A8J7V2I1_9PROT|nr:TIGR04282 family arsenosugar biosynthesis glycosyltransferase [Marivibrio halodurans]MBP5858856.1 TIGR04282 family arsenosugar biosynthesis glycosyltransferase [Marivibrio halodurans]